MKSILGFLSFVLIAGGISGLIREWLHGFALFGFLRHLSPDGYEVYANLVFIVLGTALALVNRSLPRQTPS
ncbi:hypothetical protein ACWCQL_00090 [Streptomyces sp. NPDC002073]|uniref:hypothetical protein n=1 Tax=Streptomyces sp. NBC_00239 TaxID=2903640 RepID=UPI002E2D15BC|nr:hypothetical protein [Streptomyces sp. NBC_00239]